MERGPAPGPEWYSYFDNSELEAWARNFTAHPTCGPISRLYEIGQSSEGRPLLVLELSDRPEEPEPEPQFKVVANIHGNEPVGRQMAVYLADELCRGWAAEDPELAPLVGGMHTHLLLSMNPDGFYNKERTNAKGRDLNRDFPDPNLRRSHELAGLGPSGKEQAETRAVMDWALPATPESPQGRGPFTASLAFHEGAFVVNYPNDAGKNVHSRAYSAAPDDATFKWLSLGYATHNPRMMSDKEFDGRGITNGAAWYPVTGGMQDWNYYAAKTFDLTLEVSIPKWPPAKDLPKLWDENRRGILETMRRVGPRGGLHGGVADAASGAPLAGARVQVEGIDWATLTGALGDFHRPLVPGKAYRVTASLKGYEPKTVGPLSVEEGKRLDIKFDLEKKAGALAGGVEESESRDSLLGSLSRIRPSSSPPSSARPRKSDGNTSSGTDNAQPSSSTVGSGEEGEGRGGLRPATLRQREKVQKKKAHSASGAPAKSPEVTAALGTSGSAAVGTLHIQSVGGHYTDVLMRRSSTVTALSALGLVMILVLIQSRRVRRPRQQRRQLPV